MRIATLQIAAKLGDVEGNIRRADEVLANATLKVEDPERGLKAGVSVDEAGLDILVLSEMALTGYNFPSLDAVKPYAEPAGRGRTAVWAKETAKRLGCIVCVGYPEIETTESQEGGTAQQAKYYNSLLMVSPTGSVLHNYRKAFLYYTDETWASEGSAELGFQKIALGLPQPSPASKSITELDDQSLTIGSREIPTTFGICMDINPYRFEAPYSAFEFAHRVLDSRSELVIVSMAWLTLLTREELDALSGRPEMDTFNYWIQRFLPLINERIGYASNPDRDLASIKEGDGKEEEENQEKRIILVFANRAGEEDGIPLARYAGTSTIIAVSQLPRRALSPGRSRSPSSLRKEGESSSDDDGGSKKKKTDFDVKILCWGMLGATTEGVCFADTAGEPEMVFQLVRKAG
ncbi:carbon-nitrogen hydrolase [Aspergillus pseudoustus]|uniref:Carbon-nitrogen hydrolase n=1 Tax=Aspergillus pseudoustus TaxID=1810923 RepID=A0ABR4JLT9_9EURO